ncbi:MAG TPA: glycosyltransferase family 1 protein [Verrucomicrobiae bacterium]|nr:glycosyltransferase family 1 protein [Verrucomicrobiae bacterium]
MRIGIEAERANLTNPTGVERYATELIKKLAEKDSTNEYILYFRTKPQEWFYKLPLNFKLKVIPFPKFWTQTRLTMELLLHPVDVFFMPIQALPFVHPRNSVITVHDVAYEMFPEAFAPFALFYLKLTTRWGVWRAKKIISVSDSTKNDLVKIYGLNPEKITTAHLGLDDGFKPQSYGDSQKVLDNYGLSYKKYILYIGTLQPRKNIVRLIDAYLELRKNNRIEEKLVIAGGKGWLWEPIVKKIQENQDNGVVYLEYVPYNHLNALYSGATVVTLPALYEGFGLPPLEAMACGTPVVVSNISSLPEVVGDSGVLVDPQSVDSIADGLLKVLMDKNLQSQMSQKGLERSKQFTWEHTANKVLEVLNSFKQ